jgi:hypothetical protein
MREPVATLDLVLDGTSNEPIKLMLEIFTVSWLQVTELRVTVNATEYPLIKPEPGARRFLVLDVTPERGRVSIEFGLVGDIAEGPDPRKSLCVGLGSVSYSYHHDPLSRVTLLEYITYVSNRVTDLQPALADEYDRRSVV